MREDPSDDPTAPYYGGAAPGELEADREKAGASDLAGPKARAGQVRSARPDRRQVAEDLGPETAARDARKLASYKN